MLQTFLNMLLLFFLSDGMVEVTSHRTLVDKVADAGTKNSWRESSMKLHVLLMCGQVGLLTLVRPWLMVDG